MRISRPLNDRLRGITVLFDVFSSPSRLVSDAFPKRSEPPSPNEIEFGTSAGCSGTSCFLSTVVRWRRSKFPKFSDAAAPPGRNSILWRTAVACGARKMESLQTTALLPVNPSGIEASQLCISQGRKNCHLPTASMVRQRTRHKCVKIHHCPNREGQEANEDRIKLVGNPFSRGGLLPLRIDFALMRWHSS